uniref:Uncharacterized protein n=1 Tax=Oryza rufipogon TaxID=4529 RepID=A0A0E0RGQ5_ORYRU
MADDEVISAIGPYFGKKLDLELIYGKKSQCSKEAALDSSTVSTTYPLDLRLMKEDTHNIWLAPVVGYVFEVIRWEYNLIYSVMATSDHATVILE